MKGKGENRSVIFLKLNSGRRNKFLILLILVITASYAIQIYDIFQFPSQIDIFKGDSKKIDIIFPFTISLIEKENILKEKDLNKENLSLKVKNSVEFESIKNGTGKLQFKLLGFIPLRSISVNVIDKIYLVPGGQAIGVKLNTKGVLVVALSDITSIDGHKYNPAKDAGIKIGDTITEINDIKVKDADHVIDILNNIKEEVKINVLRNGSEYITKVKPVKCNEDNSYRIGLWVRDKTAGIGTLTFYHPETKKFGALGHGITDIDTGTLMTAEDGEIMKAKISSIEHGKKGSPGEIRGIFFETEDLIGNIEKNTRFGIYGTAYTDLGYSKKQPVLPVGFQDEVKEGKAYILTTTENNKIEKFEINIIKRTNQTLAEQKSMIIEVIDNKLIQKTGGIVQGMSGSPIIQNGKIIGAVTHVFVNDPKKGYGLYIEWMLKEAGIVIENNTEFALVN